MKRILSAMLILVMGLSMCACGDTTGDEVTQSPTSSDMQTVAEADDTNKSTRDVQPAEESTAIDTLSEASVDGSPWVSSVVREIAQKYPNTELKDDFYLAANRQWIDEHQLEEGVSADDFLSSFSDELRSRLLRLMTDKSLPDSPEKTIVQTLYEALSDWDARDAAGVSPLEPYIEEIEAIKSVDELMDYFCQDKYIPMDIFTERIIYQPDDTSKKLISVEIPIYTLMECSDYDDLDNLNEYSQALYDGARSIVVNILTKIGYTQKRATEIYENSIRFEQMCCSYGESPTFQSVQENIDFVKKQTFKAEELDQFGLFATVHKMNVIKGYPEDCEYFLDGNIEFYKNFDNIVCDSNLELVKSYLIAHTAFMSCDMLDSETKDMGRTALSAMQDYINDVDDTDYIIECLLCIDKWALSKLYCDEYVSEKEKNEIYELCRDIIEEYKLIIRDADFLSEESKAHAILKLKNMNIVCMYPDEWRDFTQLELSGSIVDMMLQVRGYEEKLAIVYFTKPVDHAEFSIPPIEQAARYLSSGNAIYILPGLIGDVLYNEEMPIEEVYAKLGVVIGHEVSHSFDPDGAQYDENGNLNCWWSEEELAKFDELTDRMVEYMDSIVLLDGLHVNGESSKGEMCADMAGLKVTLRLASKQDNFDYDLFFRKYAETWAASWTEEYLEYVTLYDVHPSHNIRANLSLAQCDEFYETYGIKEGDGMYIAPEDRIAIW